MRGRKKTPTETLKRKGNPGKRNLKKREAELPDAPPLARAEPPEFLSDEAKKHWHSMFDILENAGILSVHDQPAFIILCQNLGMWIELTEKQNEIGYFARDDMGVMRPTPYFNMALNVQKELTKLFAEFGMTPSSRERVKRLNPKKPKDDKWGDF